MPAPMPLILMLSAEELDYLADILEQAEFESFGPIECEGLLDRLYALQGGQTT